MPGGDEPGDALEPAELQGGRFYLANTHQPLCVRAMGIHATVSHLVPCKQMKTCHVSWAHMSGKREGFTWQAMPAWKCALPKHGKFICRAECLIRQVHCACPGGQRIPLRVDPEEVARGLPRDQPGDRGEAARSAAVGRRHEPRLRVRACALHGLLLQHFIGLDSLAAQPGNRGPLQYWTWSVLH